MTIQKLLGASRELQVSGLCAWASLASDKCVLVDCFVFSFLLLMLSHLFCIACPLPLQKHGKRTKQAQVVANKSLPPMTKKTIQMTKTKKLSSTMTKKKRKTAMRTSWMTQQCQPTKAPVELTRSLLQQDEHLNARPRTMMEWKVFCHPSSISTFLKGSSVMRLSSNTQLVPCIVPLCTDAADLHPMLIQFPPKMVENWLRNGGECDKK